MLSPLNVYCKKLDALLKCFRHVFDTKQMPSRPRPRGPGWVVTGLAHPGGVVLPTSYSTGDQGRVTRRFLLVREKVLVVYATTSCFSYGIREPRRYLLLSISLNLLFVLEVLWVHRPPPPRLKVIWSGVITFLFSGPRHGRRIGRG